MRKTGAGEDVPVVPQILLDEPLEAGFVPGPNTEEFHPESCVARPHHLCVIHRDREEVYRQQQVQLDTAPDRQRGGTFNGASGQGKIDDHPLSGHILSGKGAGTLNLDSC